MSQPNHITFSRFHRPGPGTPSVAWRLFWIWPEQRLLHVYWAFCVSVLLYRIGRYVAVYPDSPFQYTPLVVLGSSVLFCCLFPSGEFTFGAARALSTLPVSRRRLRRAAWFSDVVAGPAMALPIVLLLLGITTCDPAVKWWMLILTVSALAAGSASKAGALLRAFNSANFGAATKSTMFRYADFGVLLFSALLLLWSCNQILRDPTVYSPATVIVPSLLLTAWAYWRAPTDIPCATEVGPISPTGKVSFSSTKRILAISTLQVLAPCMLAVVCLTGLHALFPSLLNANGALAAVVVSSNVLVAKLHPQLRSTRALPLSTWTLTRVVLLHAAAMGLTGAVVVVGYGLRSASEVEFSWLLLAALALGLSIASFAVLSVWQRSHPLFYIMAFLAALLMNPVVDFLGNQFDADSSLFSSTRLMAHSVLMATLFTFFAYLLHTQFFRSADAYRQIHQGQSGATIKTTSAVWERWIQVFNIGAGLLVIVLASLIRP